VTNRQDNPLQATFAHSENFHLLILQPTLTQMTETYTPSEKEKKLELTKLREEGDTNNYAELQGIFFEK